MFALFLLPTCTRSDQLSHRNRFCAKLTAAIPGMIGSPRNPIGEQPQVTRNIYGAIRRKIPRWKDHWFVCKSVSIDVFEWYRTNQCLGIVSSVESQVRAPPKRWNVLQMHVEASVIRNQLLFCLFQSIRPRKAYIWRSNQRQSVRPLDKSQHRSTAHRRVFTTLIHIPLQLV